MTLDRRLSYYVIEAWPTPLITARMAGFAQANIVLERLILELKQSSPGMKTSNVGAWQSDSTFLKRTEPEIEQVKNAIYECATVASRLAGTSDASWQLEIEGWTVVHEPGHYTDLHLHHDAVWSGVYYVAARPSAAALELVDPRPGARICGDAKSNSVQVEADEGRLVLFPSWLLHRVKVQQFGTRIAIAFNVGIRPADDPA